MKTHTLKSINSSFIIHEVDKMITSEDEWHEEKFILGVYHTENLAHQRVKHLVADEADQEHGDDPWYFTITRYDFDNPNYGKYVGTYDWDGKKISNGLKVPDYFIQLTPGFTPPPPWSPSTTMYISNIPIQPIQSSAAYNPHQ